MEKRPLLRLKGPVPPGVLARIALQPLARMHVEAAPLIEEPFPMPVARPVYEPASKVSSPSTPTPQLMRTFEQMRSAVYDRYRNGGYAEQQFEDLESRFRIRLKDRAGADYRDSASWGARKYLRLRNGGDNSWRCHRSTQYRGGVRIDFHD